MVKGIGIDIVEIKRLKAAVNKHGKSFLKKIFTDQEIAYCSHRRALKFPELAVRFAAKEAYAKAIGTGINGIGWKEIEVVSNPKGQPFLKIKGKLSRKVQVSLSHSRDYAVASVYVEN